jgi:hypothetical protein
MSTVTKTEEPKEPKAKKGRKTGSARVEIRIADLVQEMYKIQANPETDPRDNLTRLAEALGRDKTSVKAKIKKLAERHEAFHALEVDMFLGSGEGRVSEKELMAIIARAQGTSLEIVQREVSLTGKEKHRQYLASKPTRTRKEKQTEASQTNVS